MGIAGLEVVTDNSHRIQHFLAGEEVIQPQDVGQYLDGGERLNYRGREYDILENGSLVHPDIELRSVVLGDGVMLGFGVTFEQVDQPDDGGADAEKADGPVVIGQRARVERSRLFPGVSIGNHSVVVQSHLASGARLESFVRVREDTYIGRALLRHGVKVDKECSIGDDSVIEMAAKLGYRTVVGPGVTIGELCRVGKSTGAVRTEREKEGIMIAAGRVIPPRTRVLEDVI